MPALSRSQQQLIIGDLAWTVLDLYAASLARARSGERAMADGTSAGPDGGERRYGRRRDDRPGAGTVSASL